MAREQESNWEELKGRDFNRRMAFASPEFLARMVWILNMNFLTSVLYTFLKDIFFSLPFCEPDHILVHPLSLYWKVISFNKSDVMWLSDEAEGVMDP